MLVYIVQPPYKPLIRVQTLIIFYRLKPSSLLKPKLSTLLQYQIGMFPTVTYQKYYLRKEFYSSNNFVYFFIGKVM